MSTSAGQLEGQSSQDLEQRASAIGKLRWRYSAQDLTSATDGVERVLAIMTRNNNSGGVAAVLGALPPP